MGSDEAGHTSEKHPYPRKDVEWVQDRGPVCEVGGVRSGLGWEQGYYVATAVVLLASE